MEIDVREFLKRFSFEELLKRNILSPWTRNDRTYYRLSAESYVPLLTLMNQHGITRLESRERNWYVTSDGDFANPHSKEITKGNVDELNSLRHVFREGYGYINPYYYHQPIPDIPDGPHESGHESQLYDSSVVKFGLERDLQRALRNNIGQLELGLKVVDGGTERTVEAGRIDITAEDTQGNLVVIELKADTAQPESIAQLLSYMGSIDDDQGRPVRGILVAYDFHPRLVMAARAVPNISLKAYSFQFSFEDR